MSHDRLQYAMAPGGSLHALAALKSFLIYRKVWNADKAKFDKKPIHSWINDAGLFSFEDALSQCRAKGEEFGVGLAIYPRDPYFCIDLDDCVTKGTRQLTPFAQQMVDRFPGAPVELSTNGTGLHIWGWSAQQAHSEKNSAYPGLEVYGFGSSRHFIALTGDMFLMGNPHQDYTRHLAGVIEQYVPAKVAVGAPRHSDNFGDGPCPEWRGIEDDQQLIEKFCASNRLDVGAAFGARRKATNLELWTADEDALAEAFPESGNQHRRYDESSADASLAARLAFWTGRDVGRIERLMRESALVREKWDDHATYLAGTIEKACANCPHVYGEESPKNLWTMEPHVKAKLCDPTELLIAQMSENPTFASAWSNQGPEAVIPHLARVTGGWCQGIAEMLKAHPAQPVVEGALKVLIEKECDRFAPDSPLDQPLADPANIYHPSQIKYAQNTKTGEWYFKEAFGTSENLARLIKAYGVQVRYNELAHSLEVFYQDKPLQGDLAKNVQITLIEDLAKINSYPHAHVLPNMDKVASANSYNPARDWVCSRAWDGQARLRQLFECLTLKEGTDADFAYTLFSKWFLGAVALLVGATNKFEHMLVLVDEFGGEGKTRFFNSWSPAEFQVDGVTLNTQDKDAVLQVTSRWLVELGELDSTFRRSDIAALKAFLSKSEDEIRPAYARASNRYRRQTAFMGTVNDARFLSDDTSNRRFFPIHVTGVRYQHDLDMQQVWAEAKAMIEAGHTWWLDAAQNRAIGEHNSEFKVVDPVEEALATAYDNAAVASRELSATQVCADVGLGNPNRALATKVGMTLGRLGFQSRVIKGIRRYKLPPRTLEIM